MDKQTIEQFAQQLDIDIPKKNYEIALNLIINALERVYENKVVSTIHPEEVRIFGLGEYTNNTYIALNDEIEIALVTSNPQMGYIDKTYVKLLDETKNKKARENLGVADTTHKFMNGMLDELAKEFAPETNLLMTEQGIKILCNKEYGFKILLRMGTYNAYDAQFVLNLWNPVARKIDTADVFGYTEIMLKKDETSNGNFSKLTRILKNLRKMMVANKWINSGFINKYLIELMALNVPDSLLTGETYDIFVKSINYLQYTPLNRYTYGDKSISEFPFANASLNKITSFINKCTQLLAMK